MGLAECLERWQADPSVRRQVTAWRHLPRRPGRYAPFPANLDLRLVEALRRRGVERAYIHQAQAIEAALAGRHVVVVTATASGKTLCYNSPVLHTLLQDEGARALYLFPTKALAQDQLDEVQGLLRALGTPVRVDIYDGDTPPAARAAIRREARLVISNPDMLHTGILPHHTRWAEFFAGLRFVVLDELHVYRGVFGSHVANVLRRLRRVARFYGARPQFLCSSATIANPSELAEALVEEPCVLVDEDGAPKGEKHVLLYNPPLVQRELGIRRSPVLEARTLAANLLDEDVQTLVFTRARQTAEVLLTYLRDVAAARGWPLDRVRGYRGGYLPTERRAIEAGLREGSVRAVVATNALELGVDIGDLSAVVMTSYPGTIASTWQQAGRAGRGPGVSLAVLIAGPSPLDQYLVRHPEYFFGRTPEQAILNPDNLRIVVSHLQCAAFELPFREDEAFGRFPYTQEVLEYLAELGVLRRAAGLYHWMQETYPVEGVSLRTADPDRFLVVEMPEAEGAEGGRVVGEVDRASAPLLIHPGAIYMHEGDQYEVVDLDWEGRRAWVRPVRVGYYTDAGRTEDVQVLEVQAGGPWGEALRGRGRVRVVSRVTGYRKVRLYTHESLGWVPLDLPEQEMETTAFWLTLPETFVERLRQAGLWEVEPLNDYGPNWEVQRRRALERDRHICQHCGAPERPDREHDVHHIRPFREFGYVPGENENYVQANDLANLVTLCRDCHRLAELAQRMRSSLSGLGYLLGQVAPLHVMCDPRDLGTVVEMRARETGWPTIFLYDRVPGGAGFSERLYGLLGDLLRAAKDVVEGCPCRGGCPSCVGPSTDVGPDVKAGTLGLVDALLGPA